MIDMSRPKDDVDRPRSIRIPVSEEEFAAAHALAGKVPLTTFLRDLIMAEAEKRGLKPRKGSKR